MEGLGVTCCVQFLFLMEKSILYDKITVSQKKIFFNVQFSILYRPFIFMVTIMSQILINI